MSDQAALPHVLFSHEEGGTVNKMSEQEPFSEKKTEFTMSYHYYMSNNEQY